MEGSCAPAPATHARYVAAKHAQSLALSEADKEAEKEAMEQAQKDAVDDHHVSAREAIADVMGDKVCRWV